MNNKDSQHGDAAKLRQQAEEIVHEKAAQPPDNIEALSLEESRKALQELRVHQIELEIQNEELRRTQAELEASRARYFEFYDLAPVGFLTVSEKGLILEANLRTANLLGVARGGLVTQSLSRFIFPQDQNIYHQQRKRLFETGVPMVCEVRMARHNETLFWARIEATAAQDAGGKPVCRVVMSDITEHRRADIALRQSEKRYREVVENLNEGLWLIDQDARITFVNPRLAEMLEYTPDEMKGRTLFSFMDTASAAMCHKKLERSRRHVREIYQLDFLRKDGRRIHTRLTTAPILDEQGLYAGAVAGVMDITERLALEREVLNISEREQRRIGEDLHDGLGQELTAIELLCSSLKNDQTADRAKLRNLMEQMSRLLCDAIRQTRMLAHGLMGFKLTSHGLSAALTELAQGVSSLGRVRCRFDCPEPVFLNDTTITSHLYRIAQEAVNNAVKHAQASQVTILVKESGGENLLAAIRLVLRGRVYLSPEMSVKVLNGLSGPKTRDAGAPIGSLSDREFEIFQLVGQGKSTVEIARQLHLSPKTVDVHRGHIKQKLELKDATALVRYAVRWVETEDSA